MNLSKEQKIAFQLYKDGHNVFITGPGGTGKSALIKLMTKDAYLNNRMVYVTALTGCAAILLNDSNYYCKVTTVHSWAGIGLGVDPVQKLVAKIMKTQYLYFQWVRAQTLIIDEVSMMSLKLFQLLNVIGQRVRRNGAPFGGIQLIFSGDFYQLPPVGDLDCPDSRKFCFECEEWNQIFRPDCQIQLREMFRQTDPIYSTILNQIREGVVKRSSHETLIKCVDREPDPELLTKPTKLFPTRKKVDDINEIKLSELPGNMFRFSPNFETALAMSKSDTEIRRQFQNKDIETELQFILNNILCKTDLMIKVGAQVMCVVNIVNEKETELCNGSQGIVTGFCAVTGNPRVKWNSGIERVMNRHLWTSNKIPGIGISHIPLILAWALTIHKSQGSTLDAAEIDIGRGVFECGQSYVALSRVRNLSGLYLTALDVTKIKVNKKVKEYYEKLKECHQTLNDHQSFPYNLTFTPIEDEKECITDDVPANDPDNGTESNDSFEAYRYKV